MRDITSGELVGLYREYIRCRDDFVDAVEANPNVSGGYTGFGFGDIGSGMSWLAVASAQDALVAVIDKLSWHGKHVPWPEIG